MLVRIHPECGHELYRIVLIRLGGTTVCGNNRSLLGQYSVYFGKILESVGCKAALVDLRLGGCPFF